MTEGQARQILAEPHEWPSTLVQAAAQRMTQKAARSRRALLTVAERNEWFPDVAWRTLT
jgi:hypothetical protein